MHVCKSSLYAFGALIYEDVCLSKVLLQSRKILSLFQFFILSFKFPQTLPRKAIPQVSCLVQCYF